MLVLSQLRDTYWSASVIYRLFERAQLMLDKSNSGSSTQNGKSTTSAHSPRTQSNGENTRIDHQQQQSLEQTHQRRETDGSIEILPESNHFADEQGTAFWMNESPYFSNVDQLLSPSFFISENTFQSVFPGYDQMIPVLSDAPMGLPYSI
jgi:hypothetical protein